MRHQKNTRKLGRTSAHRDAMLANMTVSLIEHNRIRTTLAKAKTLRPFAEKLITLGKKGTLHHRRQAIARLGAPEAVARLFKDIAPRFSERNGGYTRIYKLGPRQSDSAEMALIEWVDYAPREPKAKAKGTAAGKASKTPATEKKAAAGA